MESNLPVEELDSLIDDLDTQVTEEQVPEYSGGSALCNTGLLCTVAICA